MFTSVVTMWPDNTYVIEYIQKDVNKERVVAYHTYDNMPEAIKKKINLLVWLPVNDRTGLENVGIRVGDTMFWII